MKLVKIKDVRPGQVWQFDENMCRCFVVERTMKTKTCGTTYQAFDCPTMPEECKGELYIRDYDMPKIPHGKLIGKIGITHRVEGNRLVEIPPLFKDQKINIGDIVKVIKDDTFPWVVDTTYNSKKYKKYISLLSYHDCDFSEEEVEKIGILGVTHEFANDREEE